MLFSIIIPVYNVEKYLIECVNSLRDQTFRDFEAIFVDDGSKDSSGEICDSLAADYPSLNIKVFHQSNSGQIAARQKGMELSEGEYCLFLDSDDTFTPDALQKVAEAINKYQADIVIFNGVRHFEDKFVPFWSHYSQNDLYMQGDGLKKFYTDVISTNRFNNICFKAIKRSVINQAEKYDKVSFIKTEEDYLMQLPIFDKAKSIVYIPSNIYIYRYNSESITNVPFDINLYKAGKYIFKEKQKYSRKWNVQDGQIICNRYFMGRTASAIRQFKAVRKTMPKHQKLAMLKMISSDSDFRHEYRQFDGVLGSKVGKVCLWLLYHYCLRPALFVAEHVSKVNRKEFLLVEN